MTEPNDTLSELRERLQRLHRENGEPSTREIARRTCKAISHTTVAGVLHCAKSPRWGQLELVVEALGGNADEFHRLWVADRDSADQLAQTLTADSPAGASVAAPSDPGFQPAGPPLTGHTDFTWMLAFDADGDLLASASDDGTVRLWDPLARSQVGEPLSAPETKFYAIAFHSEENLLAGGGSGGTVLLWDPDTGKQVGTVAVADRVNSLAFRPHGRSLASAGGLGVRFWDPETGLLIREVAGHIGVATSLAFHPDGHLLASGSSKGTVQLWDPETGEEVSAPLKSSNRSRIGALAFHPDGHLVAAVQDNELRLWDPSDPGQIRMPLAHLVASGSAVAWHPEGHMLATASWDDSEVSLWDSNTGRQIGRGLEFSRRVCLAVAFHPSGHMLATGGYDDNIQLWEQSLPYERPALPPARARLRQLRSNYTALKEHLRAEKDRTERLYFTTLPSGLRELAADGGPVTAIAFHPSRRYSSALLAAAGSDCAIRFWNSASGQRVGDLLPGHGARVNEIGMDSGNNDLLATVSDDGMLRIWKYKFKPQLLATLEGHTGRINAVSFDPRESRRPRLATVGDDGALALWYYDTELHTSGGGRPFAGNDGPINAVAFHPAGGVLSTGGDDGMIRLWNVGEWPYTPYPQPLAGNCGSVTKLEFEPCHGRLLASLSDTGIVRIWNWENRQLVQVSSIEQIGPATAIAFHPDGRQLSIVAEDGTVYFWDSISGQVHIAHGLKQSGNTIIAAIRADGFLYATLSRDGTVHLRPFNIDCHCL
jgi:WD40 repeat protein